MTRGEAIGQALAARIAELGLTNAEVARRSGIDAANVGAYLRGRCEWPTAAVVVRLAAAVGWTARELLAAAGPLVIVDLPSDLLASIPADVLALVQEHEENMLTFAELAGLGDVKVADPAASDDADKRRRGAGGGRWEA